MLKWILGIAGGLVWCLLVFVVTWWVTFPSTAIVDRARYEIQEASDGAYALTASSASPWWTGVSLANVQLLAVDSRSEESSLVLEASSVAARTSLWSLLGSSLPIYGVVDLKGSSMVVNAEVDRSTKPPRVKRIDGHADALSVNGLGALLAPYGLSLTGTGTVEVDVDLEIADVVQDHDGRISAKGKNLDVTISMPDFLAGEGEYVVGPIAVSNLDLVVDIRNGKATIKKAMLRSDHGNLTLSGVATLNQKLSRSRIRGDVVLGELAGDVKLFEGAMRNARWDDEQFHYRISCSLDRMTLACFKPERQRGGAASGGRTAITPAVAPDMGSADDKSPEELREERRALREQRLAERRANIDASRPQRPEQQIVDEEIIDDEEDDEEDDGDELPDLITPDPRIIEGARPELDLVPLGPGAVPYPPGGATGAAGDQFE